MRRKKKPVSPIALRTFSRLIEDCVVICNTTNKQPHNQFFEQTAFTLLEKHLGKGGTLPNWQRLTLVEKAALANMSLFQFGTPYTITINLNEKKRGKLLSKDKRVRDAEYKNIKDQLRDAFKSIGEQTPLFWVYIEKSKQGRIEPHIHGGFVMIMNGSYSEEQSLAMLKKGCRWALPNKGTISSQSIARYIEIDNQLNPKRNSKPYSFAGWGTYSTKKEEFMDRDSPMNRNRNDFFISNALRSHAEEMGKVINNRINKQR